MSLVLQIFRDGEFEVDAARLEDDTELLAHSIRVARDVEALNASAPAGRRHQRGEDAKERGFAAAVRAEEAEDLTGAHLEAEAVEREALSVAMGQAVEHDGREGGPLAWSGET